MVQNNLSQPSHSRYHLNHHIHTISNNEHTDHHNKCTNHHNQEIISFKIRTQHYFHQNHKTLTYKDRGTLTYKDRGKNEIKKLYGGTLKNDGRRSI